MANEFIARKGLIVLNNGAKITGSLNIQGDINATGYNVTASNLQLSGNADIDGNVTIGGNITVGNADIDVVKFLAEVSSSIVPDINNAFDIGSGSKYWRNLYASGTAYINDVQATTATLGTTTNTGNLTVNGTTYTQNQSVYGNIFLSGSNRFIYNNDATNSMLFGFYDGSTISGPYYQIFGNNYSNVSQRGSAEFVYDTRNGGDANFHVASFDGSTWVQRFRVDNGGIEVTGSVEVTGPVTASAFKGDGTQITNVTAASVDYLNVTNKPTLVSASSQIDVTQTTNIATIATTGSNTFTGIQTISNTTNSTNYTDGALVVAGGVGIGKDVNISGSLTVSGLLTVVSMSTQYVTSSQVLVADNEIILNTTNAVRFGGVSVVDSGSTTPLTGSLYWDSFTNRWIVQNISGSSITSGIFILGPENTGATGTEVSLVEGRIPVATEGNHIDNRSAYSPLRIEGSTLHAEENVYVTGSVSASAFAGDGSNLTGIVTNLNITGSDGGTATVSLKTQALTVDGTNGMTATAAGQTITISGSNATTLDRGVASFTGSNFNVVNGEVSSKPINFNGADINLGGTHAFGLQNITPYGASTTDQVTLAGGAIIQGVLFVTASNLDVDTGTEVVATVSTGSYDSAFFDYVVKKDSNYRVGTVMAVWDNANNVEFTDTSTNDLGNTYDVSFTVDILSGVARLKATVVSDNWIIKTAVRAF